MCIAGYCPHFSFNIVESSFQMMGAATEKARLPRFSFVLGIESCCEVDDQPDKVVDVLQQRDM